MQGGSPLFSIFLFIYSEASILSINRLPQSKAAIENALIMKHSHQWVLLVDPQELGNTFIKAYYSGEGMVAEKDAITYPAPLKKGQQFMTLGLQTDAGFRENLIRAIELGSVLLLENLDEEMEDIVEQVLQQQTFSNNSGYRCLKLGDSSAMFHPDFRLFVTTRHRSPRFPFMVLRNLSVVNFSITRVQMTEILVTATLKHEMPELGQEHGSLMRQKAKSEAELDALEKRMLEKITVTSTEDLLGESEVYKMLVASHGSATAIKNKVLNIERNQARIVEVRQLIEKHLVSRVSAFFFVLIDMGAIRRTYQFR